MCANAFVCSAEDIRDMSVCAPKYGNAKCIVWPGNWTQSTFTKNPANTIVLKVNNLYDVDIFDLVISTQVGDSTNVVPAVVQNIMIQEFVEKRKIPRVERLSKSPHCVLLIDKGRTRVVATMYV